jgi:hypothetical protein
MGKGHPDRGKLGQESGLHQDQQEISILNRLEKVRNIFDEKE